MSTNKPKLPIITDSTVCENMLKLNLQIPEDLLFFEGHFKDYPLVPGVVQIHWVNVLSAKYFNLDDIVREGNQIKFSNPILPNDNIELEIENDYSTNQIKYTYYRGNTKLSSGRLTYRERVGASNEI